MTITNEIENGRTAFVNGSVSLVSDQTERPAMGLASTLSVEEPVSVIRDSENTTPLPEIEPETEESSEEDSSESSSAERENISLQPTDLESPSREISSSSTRSSTANKEEISTKSIEDSLFEHDSSPSSSTSSSIFASQTGNELDASLYVNDILLTTSDPPSTSSHRGSEFPTIVKSSTPNNAESLPDSSTLIDLTVYTAKTEEKIATPIEISTTLIDAKPTAISYESKSSVFNDMSQTELTDLEQSMTEVSVSSPSTKIFAETSLGSTVELNTESLTKPVTQESTPLVQEKSETNRLPSPENSRSTIPYNPPLEINTGTNLTKSANKVPYFSSSEKAPLIAEKSELSSTTLLDIISPSESPTSWPEPFSEMNYDVPADMGINKSEIFWSSFYSPSLPNPTSEIEEPNTKDFANEYSAIRVPFYKSDDQTRILWDSLDSHSMSHPNEVKNISNTGNEYTVEAPYSTKNIDEAEIFSNSPTPHDVIKTTPISSGENTDLEKKNF